MLGLCGNSAWFLGFFFFGIENVCGFFACFVYVFKHQLYRSFAISCRPSSVTEKKKQPFIHESFEFTTLIILCGGSSVSLFMLAYLNVKVAENVCLYCINFCTQFSTIQQTLTKNIPNDILSSFIFEFPSQQTLAKNTSFVDGQTWIRI